MKQNKRILSLALIGALALSLAAPAAGFAAPKKFMNQDEIKQPGPPEWVLEKFEMMKKGNVKYNGSVIKFDTDPINKGGRILIPIRALTEGMGCDVKWDPKTMLVTVISPNENDKIVFDLDEGTVELNGKPVDIDVKPGLHNNRTYVPLRFIAETFDLDVKYDDKTGDVDVKDGPKLDPNKVVYEKGEVIDESFEIKLENMGDNWEFVKIKELGLDADADEYAFDVDDSEVRLTDEYINDLEEKNTTLTFQFENEDEDKTAERTFKIIWEDSEEPVKPELDPKDAKIDEDDVDDDGLTIELNTDDTDYDFDSIKFGTKELVLDTDYTVDDDEVTLTAKFIKTLDVGKHVLKFIFENEDGEDESVRFELTIEE